MQGCGDELRELWQTGFSADRDQLWFVGDLVNRGHARSRCCAGCGLGDAVVVLGNHDLHLLAVAYGGHRELRDDDARCRARRAGPCGRCWTGCCTTLAREADGA